jgi:hypothetical protein
MKNRIKKLSSFIALVIWHLIQTVCYSVLAGAAIFVSLASFIMFMAGVALIGEKVSIWWAALGF